MSIKILLLFCFVTCSFAQGGKNILYNDFYILALTPSDTLAGQSDAGKLFLTNDNLDNFRLLGNQYPPEKRDYKRLGINTLLYVGCGVAVFGILYASPEEVTNWNKREIRENGIFYKWQQNVRLMPAIDKDGWGYNYIGHTYFGGIYYMTARSSGFGRGESFMYSALMSVFYWEYGLEAFAEVPSAQDIVITPVLGSLAGEGFFLAKKSILKNNGKVLKSKFLGTTTLILIDPFNTFLDAVGYKQKVKGNVSLLPVGFDNYSNKPAWRLSMDIRF